MNEKKEKNIKAQVMKEEWLNFGSLDTMKDRLLSIQLEGQERH